MADMMTKWRLFSSVFALLFLWHSPVGAVTYSAGIENSEWYLSSSIFDCSLTHDIPNFGKAVFEHRAGESLRFYLAPTVNPLKPGNASLIIEAPAWRPGVGVHDLGTVRVASGERPVNIGSRPAAVMMASLQAGMMPALTRTAWYGNDPVEVRLSSVNFSPKFADFQSCVSGLLPVNFDQVSHTTLLFGDNQSTLTGSDQAKLDRLILFVKADPSVTNVYVDGHTDSTGRRLYNRLLSKDRAEAVTQYLIDHGIPAAKITTRYHGDRHPVAKNNSPAHRARNRRATVLLERNPDGDTSSPAQSAGATPAQGVPAIPSG